MGNDYLCMSFTDEKGFVEEEHPRTTSLSPLTKIKANTKL